MKVHARSMKIVLVLMGIMALALSPCVSQAAEYSLKNFLVLVDDQLILKGPADIVPNQGASVPARSDLGSRNKITLGGSATTDIPDGAPAPANPLELPDVAVVSPNVLLKAFAKVSMIVYDTATGSFPTPSGSGIVLPPAGRIFNDLGNNPLNTTGDKSLPDFPAFPTVTAGTTDVTVEASATVNIVPGNYRDLIIKAKGQVNFMEAGTYQFRRIITTTASKYSLNMLSEDIRIQVKEFVRLSEYGDVNPTNQQFLTIYVEGADGAYGGANKNQKGVTRSIGTFPAAFEYDGDGTFNACFVFVKNGTMNLRGHQSYITQWFGDSLQQISSLSISLQHPGHICYDVDIQCACITSFKLNKSTGILTVNGINFSTKTVEKLAIFSTSAAVAGVQNLTGGDLGKDQLAAFLSGLSAAGSTTFKTVNNMGTVLGPGNYYLGIIYPVSAETNNTPGYCIFVDKPLVVE
ncbi:MAG: hypothetical protein LLG06_04350 [Desulfobacteraceae bacterium]|nr:hypothetical protein [Desulfobacteraceae bacterium]